MQRRGGALKCDDGALEWFSFADLQAAGDQPDANWGLQQARSQVEGGKARDLDGIKRPVYGPQPRVQDAWAADPWGGKDRFLSNAQRDPEVEQGNRAGVDPLGETQIIARLGVEWSESADGDSGPARS